MSFKNLPSSLNEILKYRYLKEGVVTRPQYYGMTPYRPEEEYDDGDYGFMGAMAGKEIPASIETLPPPPPPSEPTPPTPETPPKQPTPDLNKRLLDLANEKAKEAGSLSTRDRSRRTGRGYSSRESILTPEELERIKGGNLYNQPSIGPDEFDEANWRIRNILGSNLRLSGTDKKPSWLSRAAQSKWATYPVRVGADVAIGYYPYKWTDEFLSQYDPTARESIEGPHSGLIARPFAIGAGLAVSNPIVGMGSAATAQMYQNIKTGLPPQIKATNISLAGNKEAANKAAKAMNAVRDMKIYKRLTKPTQGVVGAAGKGFMGGLRQIAKDAKNPYLWLLAYSPELIQGADILLNDPRVADFFGGIGSVGAKQSDLIRAQQRRQEQTAEQIQQEYERLRSGQ